MAKIQLFSLVLLLGFLTAACGQGQPAANGAGQALPVTGGTKVEVQGGAYTDISVGDLQSMLKNKDFVFVNVHIPFEGDIPQTDLSIPYDEIEQHLDKLPADKSAKIVLYCRSDRMSQIASEKLVASGYINVHNLDGGFAAWEQAGLPIER